MSTRTQEEKALHIAEQKQIMESIKVGLRDPNKDEITKIYASHTEFVVYEIKTPHLPESLRTYINTLDQDDKEISGRYTLIRKLISEAKINMFKAIDPVVYKVSLAHCISHALHGAQGCRQAN